MTDSIARAFIFYGLFVLICGLGWRISNPQEGNAALLLFGVYGNLNFLWGILIRKGVGGVRKLGAFILFFATVALLWGNVKLWSIYVSSGEQGLKSALIASSLLAASLLLLLKLAKTDNGVTNGQ